MDQPAEPYYLISHLTASRRLLNKAAPYGLDNFVIGLAEPAHLRKNG